MQGLNLFSTAQPHFNGQQPSRRTGFQAYSDLGGRKTGAPSHYNRPMQLRSTVPRREDGRGQLCLWATGLAETSGWRQGAAASLLERRKKPPTLLQAPSGWGLHLILHLSCFQRFKALLIRNYTYALQVQSSRCIFCMWVHDPCLGSYGLLPTSKRPLSRSPESQLPVAPSGRRPEQCAPLRKCATDYYSSFSPFSF